MLTNDVRANPLSEEGRQIGIAAGRLDRDKTPIREIAQPRAKPEAESSAESEDVIGGSASVGVVLRDIETRAMMQQTVEDIGRFPPDRPIEPGGKDRYVFRLRRAFLPRIRRHRSF